MPLQSAIGAESGLRPYEEWLSQQEDRRRKTTDEEERDPVAELTPEEFERYKILRYCDELFEQCQAAREPYETFDDAWNLYINNVFPRNWPAWRAKVSIAKVRAFITFMVAIMTDNKPRFNVEPEVDGTEDAADLLRKLCDRDWDDNNMQGKMSLFALYGLIWGTGFMKILYDPYANSGRGKHLAIPVVPYRVYTNRTASSVDDAEVIIHVDDVTMGWIRRNFPAKANAVYGLRGMRGTIGDQGRDQDYIRQGLGDETARIISAQSVNGNIVAPQISERSDLWDADRDTVEIKEFWIRDETLEAFERQKVVDGQLQWEPMLGEDDEPLYEMSGSELRYSEIDGAPFFAPIMRPKMQAVMESAWRAKYPNGRLVIIAADRVLLCDIPNPYQVDGFPWASWKDYDVGTFWGQGEPLAIKDLVIAGNRILTEVYHILDKIGNPSYKIDKNKGINTQQIKNKPGLLIPMEDVKAMEPLEKPPIPGEFFQLFDLTRKSAMEVVGVSDSMMGQMPASNTAFATVDQLAEAGSAVIRLKVRNLEEGIMRIGKLRVQLFQQWQARNDVCILPQPQGDFWRGEVEGSDGEGEAVKPPEEVAVRYIKYSNADLQGQVAFKVVPISSLSTSPASVWNKWVSMYDKKIVDRRWFHSKMRVEGWRTELPRVEAEEKIRSMQEAASKDKSRARKPGPQQNANSNRGRRRGVPSPATIAP